MPPERTVPRIGRPPRLTRNQVVAAARGIAARDGVEGLTMRRLADAVGVMPNALYSYFPDKSAILDGVLDDLLGDVSRPGPRVNWRRGLVALMSSYRSLLLTQPGLIALTVSRPMLGPNAVQVREDMLTLLRRGALDDGDVVNAFFAVFAYTTGFVAFETARTPGQRDAKERAQAYQLHATLPDDFPSTRAMARRLSKRPGDLEFKRGLTAVISGFAGDASGRSSRRK
jgi:TetR/AcrR family transcriptional regulator, tetracycline repressor protein